MSCSSCYLYNDVIWPLKYNFIISTSNSFGVFYLAIFVFIKFAIYLSTNVNGKLLFINNCLILLTSVLKQCVLGPTMANYYMGHIEETLLTDDIKPKTYTRFVDDIFVAIKNK